MILESPVFTVEAAIIASEAGADRLELCSNFAEGGETPGAGMLSFLKQRISQPIFVMIRPRGGDFVYSEDEITVMKEEIIQLKKLGADGFVFGILNRNGTLNKQACRELIHQAAGKPCTLHRAFDVSSELQATLEDAIDCGYHRILTSGGAENVGDGLDQITQLLNQAGERIIIMPGGGMKPEFVEPLSNTGFLKEIHASCKTIRQSEYGNTQSGLTMDFISDVPDGVLSVDPEIVKEFKNVMKK